MKWAATSSRAHPMISLGGGQPASTSRFKNVRRRWLRGSINWSSAAVLGVATLVRSDRSAPAGAAAPAPAGPQVVENGAALAATGNVLGSPRAPVRVVEFSDFQCPYCRTLSVTLDSLRERHPEQVAIVFRHFPLPTHPYAEAAAIAAECAGAQGRFDAYQRLLFDRQEAIGTLSWERLAAETGVADTAEFRACRAGSWARTRVAEDAAAARAARLTGTPTMLLGDQAVTGAVSLETLEAWIARSAPVVLGSGDDR
ncbi:MAG TPA: thioredoxin domain-containing protein [Gemmatimonadaceae bacterium]|nr:thioredoxin domain-containing protein [Gemmatimonadaceae bacterium]